MVRSVNRTGGESVQHRYGQLKYVLLLLLAAIIWGSAFVAQQVGMDYVGPFTFTTIRNVLAVLALSPLILLKIGEPKHGTDVSSEDVRRDKERANRMMWRAGIILGLFLTVAMNVQQIGLLYTTPGKAGFITAFYIVLVPIVLFFKGRRIAPFIWLAAIIAFIGLFLLTINEDLSVGLGEVLVFICAIVYTFHILLVEQVSPFVNTVRLAAIQFAVCAVLSSVLMFVFEAPKIESILAAWQPLVFAGVFSSAIAYTLQIVGQRGLSAPVASLILSLEASFAVLAGWLLLRHALTTREAIGSLLMFLGVVLAQLPGLMALRTRSGRRLRP
ncbi:MAG TPA: DMT family transporter [Fastidiosipila sp.]|nr:DMT family transporter [Fastidiosipila sp.]